MEHVVPHKVKLPAFWEKDAIAWFRLAEAVMEDNHMVEQRVMYRTVLLQIPHHVLERARGILTLADTAEHPFKAEGQTGGAAHTQHPGQVHRYPVGGGAGW